MKNKKVYGVGEKTESGITNYIQLEDFSLFNTRFAYVDHIPYIADNIFINNKIKVKFVKEYIKEQTSYVVVFCKIKKQDSHRFKDAMKKLKDNMLLFGHTDYDNICSEIFIREDVS